MIPVKEEKQGILSFTIAEAVNFLSCIFAWALIELKLREYLHMVEYQSEKEVYFQ